MRSVKGFGILLIFKHQQNVFLKPYFYQLCKRCCEALVKGDISCLVTITEFDEEAGTESCLDLVSKVLTVQCSSAHDS